MLCVYVNVLDQLDQFRSLTGSVGISVGCGRGDEDARELDAKYESGLVECSRFAAGRTRRTPRDVGMHPAPDDGERSSSLRESSSSEPPSLGLTRGAPIGVPRGNRGSLPIGGSHAIAMERARSGDEPEDMRD